MIRESSSLSIRIIYYILYKRIIYYILYKNNIFIHINKYDKYGGMAEWLNASDLKSEEF